MELEEYKSILSRNQKENTSWETCANFVEKVILKYAIEKREKTEYESDCFSLCYGAVAVSYEHFIL
jgi:hypothetical protein